jgi:hypothetical protein
VDHFSRIPALLASIILFAISQVPTPVLAQQSRTAANLEINLPEAVAEVKEAHDRYNDAINAGYKEIEAFRKTAEPLVPPRVHIKTVITTYGRDFAIASTLTHRANQPGKVGRQMQTWVRFPEGWRVVAAHVSTIDEPSAGGK